ncbi:hypothetical protein DPMN_053291 [Dreissena polymorpha]|uniref:Uncharacterized protein n=1 Tax=Dreissena polymorpha TaxID=45954 RepID=A0A9D4CMR9_DREPO|nr:hypothetical protein DPMN_053291 [Dreissena polymorpha]
MVISTQQLPYYMIPERNLMAGCGLETGQIHTWVETITDMVNEGPRIILRLPKLRQALIARPEPRRWFIKKRIELEFLELLYMNRRTYSAANRHT